MKAFHVQRLDETGFYIDLPGGSDFHESFRAIHAAQAYHESTGQRTRVVDANKTLWDSKFSMHTADNE